MQQGQPACNCQGDANSGNDPQPFNKIAPVQCAQHHTQAAKNSIHRIDQRRGRANNMAVLKGLAALSMIVTGKKAIKNHHGEILPTVSSAAAATTVKIKQP